MNSSSLTKQQLQNMKEADLRTHVLIPLFKAMGFRDVSHYHGGTGEQGKDITMWLGNVLGDREYYAVVAKAGRISGEATGRGSAAEVQMQISQALGSKFTDTADLSERQATRCWVVSSHEIKKEATTSIKSALGARANDGSVRFIDGDELWELLQRFQPERTISHVLRGATAVLDNLSEHHRVVTQIRGDTIQLGLEQKYQGAGAFESTAITAEFAIPAVAETQSVMESLDSHIRRGTAVRIPGVFVTRFDVPKPLEPFLKDGPIESIEMGQVQGVKEISTTVLAEDLAGGEYRLTGVRLRAVRIGSEEFEMQSRPSDSPWLISIVANRASNQLTVNFKSVSGPRSPKRALDSARFLGVLSRSGRLRFLDDETGLQLFACDVADGAFTGPSAGWLRFLEDLVFLQNRCQVSVNLPDNVAPEDARDVVELAANLRAGVLDKPFAGAVLTLKPHAPRDLFGVTTQDGFRLGVVREEFLEVFGTRFPLGVVAHISTRVRLTNKSQLEMQSSPADEALAVTMEKIDETSRSCVAYLKWLDDAQLSAVKAMAPGMSFELTDSTEA